MNTDTHRTFPELQSDFESADKVTIYLMGDFGMGYRKIEAKCARVRRRKYAQYESAIELRFRQPRQRTDRGTVQTSHANIVILQGWGHFDPASPWGEKEDVGGATVQTCRHSMFSSAWGEEFAARLDAHVRDTGATVLRDYRGANPHERSYR